MPELRAILFDLDDTLYPEWDYVRSGFRAVAEWAHAQWPAGDSSGSPSNALHIYKQLVSLTEQGPRDKVFDRWLDEHRPGERHRVDEMVRVYRAHMPDITLDSSVTSLLQELSNSYALAVISDGPLMVQQRKIDALGIKALVDAVVLSDRWGREFWKPHPRPYREALELLGHDPSSAIFVGDNPEKDFLGARRAGIRSVQVSAPSGVYYGRMPETDEHAPDERLASVLDIVNLLQ